MFSVTSESSATSSARSETPRLSVPDAPSQPNSFAALVDANAQAPEPPHSKAGDHGDSPQASRPAPRPEQDSSRDTSNETSATPSNDGSRPTPGKSSKPTKAPTKIDDPTKSESDKSSETGGTDAASTDAAADPTAVAVVIATAQPAIAAAQASSPATSSSTTTPLSIAAAAIAASAEASAMPAAPGTDTSPIVEAVAGAASEVNATNFTIAKTIATTPVPVAVVEAETQPTAMPQLASAVATAASKVIKSGDKLPAAHAETTADIAPSDDASQPPSATAAQPSAIQSGDPQASPHPQGKADADTIPTSSPSQADRSNSGDAATPSAGGHHAATIASQPQVSAPDALTQLGATMAAPQTSTALTIPAAQLTATAVTNLAVPVSGLAVQIAASARAGNSRFEIRLDPAELGRIDVRLDVDRHGNVTSHLTVEKPETLAMLRQDAPQLQRSLEDAGLKTGQNGLQFSLRDQSSGQQNNNNGQAERQPQRLMISEAPATPLVAANTTYSYAAGSSRGLDIRV